VRKFALKYPRFGYRRIWALLRREGEEVNLKRIWRLWKEAGLALRRRPRRRRRVVSRVAGPLIACYPRHVVTYDFMFVRTSEGRSLKILTVVDEFTRESLAIVVGYRMTATEVMVALEKAFKGQGWPEYLRSDNGPEFVAENLEKWLLTRGVKTHHIAPASPWQNAFCESFNDKVRTECLSLELFVSAEEAQEVLEAWRKHYNEERPHSSLGYRTPREFGLQMGTGIEGKLLVLGRRRS
jgi:putative transposase